MIFLLGDFLLRGWVGPALPRVALCSHSLVLPSGGLSLTQALRQKSQTHYLRQFAASLANHKSRTTSTPFPMGAWRLLLITASRALFSFLLSWYTPDSFSTHFTMVSSPIVHFWFAPNSSSSCVLSSLSQMPSLSWSMTVGCFPAYEWKWQKY